jgi:hypothetical protein
MSKRLSLLQIQKKSELLSQFRSGVRGLTRPKISKHWEKYREKKFVIEELPKYRLRVRRAKPEQKEILRQKYFDKKDIAKRKLEFGTLQVEKRVRGSQSESDYYKLRKGDIDSTVRKIFKNPKIRYVLVTLKIRITTEGLEERLKRNEAYAKENKLYKKATEEERKAKNLIYHQVLKKEDLKDVMCASESFTREFFEDTQADGLSVIDVVLKKLSTVSIYKGLEILSIHLRTVYALSKNSIKFKKHRKDKK